MKKVNKRDLIETLADRGHLSIKEAQSTMDIVFDEIEAKLLKGESVNISNFGVLKLELVKLELEQIQKHTR